MNINIDRRFFNKAFWDVRNTKTRFTVMYGGSNSSKSWSVYQFLILWLLTEADANILVLRKEGSTLRNSCFENLKQVAAQLKIRHLFNWFFSGDKRECVAINNKHRIILSGLDDPDKMKSIVGIKYVMLEEADAFNEDDFKELDRRFRGKDGIRFIIVFNPVSENHWLKKFFIDTPEYSAKSTVFKYTIDDNRFATQEDYEALERLQATDPEQYRIYRWGEWGIIKPNNPYFWAYDQRLNRVATTYDASRPVYVSFDFNVKNSCVIGQIDETKSGYQVKILEEFPRKDASLSNQYDLEELARLVARKYGRRGIKYTCDSTGNNQSGLTPGRKPARFFIETAFQKEGVRGEYFPISKNPNTDDSRSYVAALFVHLRETGNPIAIDDTKCPQLHSDLVRSKAIDGGKLDKHDCNKHDYGHLADCFRYFLHQFCFQIYKDYSRRNNPFKQAA